MKFETLKLAAVLTLIVLLIVPGMTACSDDDMFTYEVEDGKVTITGYSGEDSDVEIPEEIDTQSVVKIFDGAFRENEDIQSVSIPDSVTEIGEEAFYRCSSLEKVTMGSSVATIGDKAFANCRKLSSVHLSDSVVTMGDNTFADCPALSDINLEDVSVLDPATSDRYLELYGLKVWPDYAVKYGETEYSFDYYYYHYMSIKNRLDEGDGSIWKDTEPTYYEKLRDYTQTYVKRDYCLSLYLDELGEENKQKYWNEYDAYLIKEGTQGDLAEFKEHSEVEYEVGFYQYLINSLYPELFSKENRTQWAQEALGKATEGYMQAEHVQINKGEDAAGALANAQKVLALAKTTDDFASLISQFNQDTQMPSDGKGLPVSEKAVAAEYWTALGLLGVDSVSDIVETDTAYIVIHRLELDETQFYKNIMSDYMEERFSDTVTKYNAQYTKITPLNIH